MVARACVRLDLLSGCGRHGHFPVETAGNSDSVCRGRRRTGRRAYGALRVLSGLSPAGGRTTGTGDSRRVTPLSLRDGDSWEVDKHWGSGPGCPRVKGLTA